jgi:hypothetical protein
MRAAGSPPEEASNRAVASMGNVHGLFLLIPEPAGSVKHKA